MSNPPETAARDYRSTLFLPATDFPMKAGLPEDDFFSDAFVHTDIRP